jgi:phage terminase large subunit
MPAIQLTPAQTQIAKDTHRFRVINCGRRFGKALALDTPTLTSNGYKKLIDVTVGDFVFTEQGKLTKVLYKGPVYENRECFSVRFSDGTSIVADAEHDWMVEDKSYRKNSARNKSKRLSLKKKTTREIREKLFLPRSVGAFETNYSIPVTKPIEHRKKNLPIHPYFLGQWLGDGTTRTVGITTQDEQTVLFLYEYAKELGMQVRVVTQKGNKSSTYHIHGDRGVGNSLQAELRSLNVLSNKHIPNIYITSSKKQRLELLRGLMDSDGYIREGYCEYTTIKKVLADSVMELLWSFGIKATCNVYDSFFDGRLMGKKYRIHFSTALDVFNLERKKARQKVTRKPDISRRFIVAIDPIESVPVQCMQVDNPTHIFLAGKQLVPTHNTTLAIDQIKACSVYRESRIAYIAPTFQQARDIAWAQLKKDFSKAGATINESRLEIRLKNVQGTESIIMLRGWESIETLRGQSFDMIVLDEVASMRNFWEAWQEVVRPTLTDRKGEAMFISTPRGYNHFYDLFSLDPERPPAYDGQKSDQNFKSFHFTSYDNPNVPSEEIDAAKKQLTSDRFAQEYLADFRKTEGLVYKEFDRQRHVFEHLPEIQFVETIGGVDFGFTHPAAVATLKRDFDGNYWMTGEWYKTSHTDAQIAEYVASKKFNKVYPDPENAGGIQELRNRGVNIREVSKGSGSVVAGINTVRELFNANRLHIHSSCVNTISELEVYSYPARKNGASFDNENPLKENDDMCFSGNVKIDTARGMVAIQDVTINDLVKTPLGWSKVLVSSFIGRKEVVPFMKDWVTPSHPFATTRGFVGMDAMRYDESICISKELYQKKSSWTESRLLAIPTRLVQRIGLIFSLLARCWEVRERHSTYTSGKKKMGTFLAGIMFIIKMVTLAIINYQTWNVFQAKNILNGMHIASILKLQKNVEKTLDFVHAQQLVSGMAAPQELRSTESLQKSNGKVENSLNDVVTSVTNPIQRPSQVEADSVIKTVKHEPYALEDVYNLVVENGMYYANGILVSNCDALRYALMMDTSLSSYGSKPSLHYAAPRIYGSTSMRRFPQHG